jgi:hypothetical protein
MKHFNVAASDIADERRANRPKMQVNWSTVRVMLIDSRAAVNEISRETQTNEWRDR